MFASRAVAVNEAIGDRLSDVVSPRGIRGDHSMKRSLAFESFAR